MSSLKDYFSKLSKVIYSVSNKDYSMLKAYS